MADENTAKFTLSGKISFTIIVAVISFLVSIGKIYADAIALEKRIIAIEQREEKTCSAINQIFIFNSRIEENIRAVKDSLIEFKNDHKTEKK
jgi:hypothetical protein